MGDGVDLFTSPGLWSSARRNQHSPLAGLSFVSHFSNVGVMLCERDQTERRIFKAAQKAAINTGIKIHWRNSGQMPILPSCFANMFKPWLLKRKKTEEIRESYQKEINTYNIDYSFIFLIWSSRADVLSTHIHFMLPVGFCFWIRNHAETGIDMCRKGISVDSH